MNESLKFEKPVEENAEQIIAQTKKEVKSLETDVRNNLDTSGILNLLNIVSQKDFNSINSQLDSILDTQSWMQLQKSFNNFMKTFSQNVANLKMWVDMKNAYKNDSTKNLTEFDKKNLDFAKAAWKNIIDFQMIVESMKKTFPYQSWEILKSIWIIKNNFSKNFGNILNIKSTSNSSEKIDFNAFPKENIDNIVAVFSDLPWSMYQDTQVQEFLKRLPSLESDLRKLPNDLESSKQTLSILIRLYNNKTFNFIPDVKNSIAQNLPWLVFYYYSKQPKWKNFLFEDLK